MLILMLSLANFSIASAESSLQFVDAWVRQAPPAAKVLAGYGELKNTSDKEILIVSVSSPLFNKVEMHVSSFDGGMMRMAKVASLAIKPHKSAVFSPSGRHLMLMKPLAVIKSGMVVPVEVELSTGEKHLFELQVRR